jgi:hypothetical protein
MNNFFSSLINRITFSESKQYELIPDVLEDIEIDSSEIEEFDLQINPFDYLDKNIKYFNYFDRKYTKGFVRRKSDNYSKNVSFPYHNLCHIIGLSISFDDDLKIREIWLHGKDFARLNLNVDAGYPGKLPFGLSFGMNRNEIQTIMGTPNNSIEKSEYMPKIKDYRTKWDTYYFCEGGIEFGYDYDSERCDQLYIIKLPEDIESTKQDIRSYRSIFEN